MSYKKNEEEDIGIKEVCYLNQFMIEHMITKYSFWSTFAMQSI